MSRFLRLAFALVIAATPAIAQQPADTAAPTCAMRCAAMARVRPRAEARRTATPPVIDGRLDDAAWRDAPVLTDFRQVEPTQDAPATFRTETRILFDHSHIYVAIYAADSLGRRAIRTTELRRDFDGGITDYAGVVFDPFHDGRTAWMFESTPFEAQQDQQGFDGNTNNEEWDAVWRVRTQRTDSGWTAEMAIPWATMRYPKSGSVWGFNTYRTARRANEQSGWSPWPRNLRRFRMDFGGDLVGLEPPPPRLNLRFRPYVLGVTSRTGAAETIGDNATAKVGGEAIWAPTANSTLDLTWNTDFAQADVDRQVVNLSRFSVFFPERRQFFLESAALFDAGSGSEGLVVRPFFSRRIGLDAAGAPVRIVAGGRFTQRTSAQSLGLLVVRQAGDSVQGAATFAVGRFNRNVGSAGRLGFFGALRVDDAAGVTPGRSGWVGAIDGFTRLDAETEVSALVSPFVSSDGRSGLGATARVSRQTSSLQAQLNAALVTRDYAPPTGFVSRTDVLQLAPSLVGDLRPAWRPAAVRSFAPGVESSVFLTPGTGALQEATTSVFLDTEFNSGAQFNVFVSLDNQRLLEPQRFVPGVTAPAGAYDYVRTGISLQTDRSRWWSAELFAGLGGFYGGTLREFSPSVRFTPDPRVALAVNYELNQLDGVGGTPGRTTTHLLAPEVRLGLSPRALLSAFYQYNSTTGTGALNARMSWEFAPLSYLFLVWNDLDGIGTRGATVARRQTLTAKVQYLLQW